MKKLTLVLLLLLTVSAWAQNSKPLQLALFAPAQIVKENTSIRGVRLSLLYGKNVSVQGFDLGLVTQNTGGHSFGVQWNAVGLIEGSFTGWQVGYLYSKIDGKFLGVQSGVLTSSRKGGGFQIGSVNMAQSFTGLQFGLVNYTENMKGLQIGLVNIITRKKSWSFLPIVNWNF